MGSLRHEPSRDLPRGPCPRWSGGNETLRPHHQIAAAGFNSGLTIPHGQRRMREGHSGVTMGMGVTLGPYSSHATSNSACECGGGGRSGIT